MKPLIAIVILFAVASVHAEETYRCAGADGKAVYQNLPCKAEPKALEQPIRPPVMERARAMARLEQEIRLNEQVTKSRKAMQEINYLDVTKPAMSLVGSLVAIGFIGLAFWVVILIWLKNQIKDRQRFRKFKNGTEVAIVFIALGYVMTGHLAPANFAVLMMGLCAVIWVIVKKTGGTNALADLLPEPGTEPMEPGMAEPEMAPEQNRPKTGWRTKYQDKFQLMNKSEHTLYQRIVEAAPNLYVFSQVSMSQLLHIRNGYGGQQQLNEIGRKNVDFVLCRKDDTSIVLAIELNGPTHERPDRQRSDATKRKALEEAGIPLVVFYPDNLPDVATIRKTIALRMVERRWNEEERDERLGRCAEAVM